jgi:tetratricopeptide (TPR) repeat protein
MSETLLVRELPVCGHCAEGVLASQTGLTDKDVARTRDPTICAECKADNGQEDWPRLAGFPVCLDCEGKYRNRPYPGWLKLSFVALVALAVFAFARNWRFMAALRDLRQMERAVAARNIEKAADLAEEAARQVPEDEQLDGTANEYRGLVLLSQDQPERAAECFRKAKRVPAIRGTQLDRMLLEAEAGVAFKAKNYDEFLAKAQAISRQWPGDATAVAEAASAFACKYAVTGSEEYRKEAVKNLEKAARLAGPKNPDFKEYQPRIQHRLDTREIITREEYNRRFPSGYQPKAKS